MDDLFAISSDALGPEVTAPKVGDPAVFAILQQRNGFHAFNNALWVFSDQTCADRPGHDHPMIMSWALCYPKTRGVHTAFAVDPLGYPFFMSDYGVLRMDLETGKFLRVAYDLEGWARRILKEPGRLLKHKLLMYWQEANGPLPTGHRLIPRLPFVGGGEETPSNMIAVPLLDLINFYVDLSTQIRDLPEGATIEIQFNE